MQGAMAALSPRAFASMRYMPRAPRAHPVATRTSRCNARSKQSTEATDPILSEAAAAAIPVRTRHSVFACPVCGVETSRVSYDSGTTSIRCGDGHAVDVAREGHVNLLAAKKPSGGKKRATGDTAEMVRARRRFLDAGYYSDAAACVASSVAKHLANASRNGEVAGARGESIDGETRVGEHGVREERFESDDGAENAVPDEAQKKPSFARAQRLAANVRKARMVKDIALAERLNESRGLEAIASVRARPLIVDFGCGEGYWLEKIVEETEKTRSDGCNFAGIDASPSACKAAARRLKERAEIAVGDAQRDLPFPDASVDVAVSVFAPRNVEELARVVKRNGVAVVVSPGNEHLREVRSLRETRRLEGFAIIDAVADKRQKVEDIMCGVFPASARAFKASDVAFESADTPEPDARVFELVDDVDVVGTMRVTRDDVAALVGMGPSAFQQPDVKRGDLGVGRETDREDSAFGEDGSRTVDVTKSFVVQTFRRI